jgi:pheromone shutdown protein TraB
MTLAWPYRQLADTVLVLHLLLVLFVVAGLAAVVVGNLLRWRWVNGIGFRVAHGAAIAVVVAQAWLGIACPLTTLESWLRGQAGDAGYDAGFIEHWVQRLLYWDAPSWVFVLVYTVFGLAVLLSWWAFPPQARQRPDKSGA